MQNVELLALRQRLIYRLIFFYRKDWTCCRRIAILYPMAQLFADALWLAKGRTRSVKEFAALLGVPYGTMRAWISGKKTPPQYTADVILEKAKILNERKAV